MKTSEIQAKLQTVLTCKPNFVATRLHALGHSQCCGRCGGSGNYSFNLQHGTTCFGCGGRGYKAPRMSAKLLREVEQQVAAGDLQPYLDDLQRRWDAKRFAKLAGNRISAAWQTNPVSAQYAKIHFSRCPEEHHAVNYVCAPITQLLNRKHILAIVEGVWCATAKRYQPLTTDAIALRVDAIERGIALMATAQAVLTERGELTCAGGEKLAAEWLVELAVD